MRLRLPVTRYVLRLGLKLTLVLGCVGAAVSSSSPAALTASSKRHNPIQAENSRVGAPGWASGLMDSSNHLTNAPIQGYASEVSLLPGGRLHLHVSLDAAADYRIKVYRVGWYRGSGARLMMCLPSCRTSKR